MTNKKTVLVISLVTLVAFGIGFAIAAHHPKSKPSYTTAGDASAKGSSQKATSTDTANKAPATGNTTTSDPTSVPAKNDPYPVTT
jgi:hypothetical protein